VVEDLTSLGITPNKIDSDVGEGCEEDEDEELYHAIIVNENSEILKISEFPELNLAV